MFTDGEGRLYPAWSFVFSALIAFVAFVACGYLAATLAGDHVLRFEAIFRTSLAGVLLAAYSWLLTVGNHVESNLLAAQGLALAPGWRRQFWAGCGLGSILVALAVAAVAIIGTLKFQATLNSHNLIRMILVLWVLLVGSLAEELMFRGYPFQRLVEAIGSGGAILVFSALFGLVHLMNPGASFWGLFNTVAIGVVLSLAYLRTGALWLPWGIHFAWNATLGVVFGLPVSGIRLFNIVIRAAATGSHWLTGGTYGLEASLPGAVVVLVGLIVVWRAPWRQPVDRSTAFPDGKLDQPVSGDATAPAPRPPQLGL